MAGPDGRPGPGRRGALRAPERQPAADAARTAHRAGPGPDPGPLRAPPGRRAHRPAGGARLAPLPPAAGRTGPGRGPLAGAPARQVLPAAVRRAYRQAKRRTRRARHTPAGQARDVALHRARKSPRRARYAAEAATPAIGKPARKFARQMKRVQSVLGEHQDAVLARQAARDLGIGAHLAGENAFTYGLLYERELHHAERRQAKAAQVWHHAARPKHRRWMN